MGDGGRATGNGQRVPIEFSNSCENPERFRVLELSFPDSVTATVTATTPSLTQKRDHGIDQLSLRNDALTGLSVLTRRTH
jgi:hypothetical protein